MKKLALASVCLCLTACSQSVAVSGRVEQTDEYFVGTASGDILGNGSLVITMNNGVTCDSKFTSKVGSVVSSQGVLNCSDKRTGNFFYSGAPHSGNGFGTLSDGHKFVFTYGS